MSQTNLSGVPSQVASSALDQIPSDLTTNENDAAFDAVLQFQSGKHNEESSMTTRYAPGFSGYSIVKGTVSVSSDLYSAAFGVGAR